MQRPQGRTGRLATSLAAVAALAALLSGCPLEWEKESSENAAPFTFFDFAPGDTTYSNQVSFRWLGTDLDNDVVAYQYQLVETDERYYFFGSDSGQVIRSIEPRGDTSDTLWTERVTDNFQAFSDLADGWYEMRARSIDSRGTESRTASSRFYVFFDDIDPSILLVPNPTNGLGPCGRIAPRTSWSFFIEVADSSRSGATPITALEYSFQLRAHRASDCDNHISDPFTDWEFFDEDAVFPFELGNRPPNEYDDLFDADCGWDFAARVRDPAGNSATVRCCISAGQDGCD
ncbi:hypothetical protein K8I85_01365 [bacterium]|nr:hypothetical protein [bacterium]